jgi:hypothetical protein
VQEINSLPTLDALTLKEESELGPNWRELPWATSTGHKTGKETKTGWTAWSNSLISGAYWKLTPYFDSSGGDAAAITMQVGPADPARYVALWLNMPSPDSAKSGYQLRWTVNSGSNYTVKLSKWSAGTETVLASNSSVSLAAGTTLAISDTGGTVTAWSGTGSSLTSLLSASDTAYGSGYAGIEALGYFSRSINFKAGPLMGAAVGSSSVLDNLERSESPLATSDWSKPGWPESIGSARMGSFRGYGSTSGVSGAYWGQEKLKDTWGGTLVAGTVGTGATPEGQYIALWLNMPDPASARSGYEARFTGGGSASNYKVELSKWSSGTRTVLASTTGFSLPVGTTMALTKSGKGLVLWTGSSALAPILSASDGTYASGYPGLEVNGAAGTVYNFKAARIGLPAINTSIAGTTSGAVLPQVLFSFTGVEGTTSFECSLDGGTYAACTSPKAYPGISEGPHAFQVRAVGIQGTDETPAEGTIQVVKPDVLANKVPLLDNLERSESPLATGNWSKSSWAGEIGNTRMGSYRGYGAGGALAGAYWAPKSFSDASGTLAVSGTVGTGATPVGEYLALWLNMPSPSSARSGYEARFTGGGSASSYKVELSRWSSGTRTVLASTTGVSLPVGTTMVLTETPRGALTLYTGTTSMSPVLSATDSTYFSGLAGVEVSGSAGTIYNFRAGSIDVQAPNTTITAGPQEVGPPEKASFTFISSEGASTFECSIDGGTYTSCTSPKAYPSLADGKHTFRVRAVDVVENRDETPAESDFWIFSKPGVVTAQIKNATASTATLEGEVNPNGLPTTFQFEYGPTTAYGSKAPASPAPPLSGTDYKWRTQNISGLQPDTRYHYRLTATSSGGTTYGQDRTFTYDQTAPTLSFDSNFSSASPTNYAIDIQASDPGSGASGIRKLDVLLNGDTVSSITKGCAFWLCPMMVETNWSHVFDHPLDGTDRLAVIAIDEVGNTFSKSFDLPSDVIQAKVFTGDPASGGTQISEEWTQLYTHNSRLQEAGRTVTRGTAPCPSAEVGGWCSTLRTSTSGQPFSEVSAPISNPSALSEAGTLALPRQPDFGDTIESGLISEISQPWQVLPPGSGATFEKVSSKNEASSPPGQAPQASGEWNFWIDATTKLPIKASRKQGTDAPKVTYYSYSSSIVEAGSLSSAFFLLNRPTRQEEGCIESGQLGGWSYNEAGFTHSDPRFNSVVNTEDGPLILRPEGAAADGYDSRATLTNDGVELTSSSPDEEQLHWEVVQSPDQTLEQAGSDVLVVSDAGVPSAVIQPSPATAVEVIDGEPNAEAGESGDEVVLDPALSEASVEVQAIDGEGEDIDPPCITQAAIDSAAEVHEDALAAGVLMTKPEASGSSTTQVKIWINPHPALSGVSVTDKYGACSSPNTKTFGSDGYVIFGGCPVGKSVTFTVPNQVSAGGTTYVVGEPSRTIKPPDTGWSISYDYSAVAGPPPPPAEQARELRIGAGAEEADGPDAEASSGEQPIPAQYECYAGYTRPWRSDSAIPNQFAVRSKLTFRCRDTAFVFEWWIKYHLARWVADSGTWRQRAETEPRGHGPAITTEGPFFIGTECRGLSSLLTDPEKIWRAEVKVFALADYPPGTVRGLGPEYSASDGKRLHCE